MKRDNLLITLLIITLSVFLGGLLLPHLQPVRPSAPLHLIFAIGIMPLIFGAMSYFVPVLTRTRNPEASSLLPALLALAAGGVVSLSLYTAFFLFPLAALLGLGATLWLMHWIRQRRSMMLGNPHPGLLWYQLALIALVLGLLAILSGYFFESQWPALRRLHLHLNILGFIGFTALGTLRVLLPTTGSYADPQAGPWLIKGWPWLAAGTLLTAIGATWLPPLALVGSALWLWPPLAFAKGLLLDHRKALWHWHGATVPLLCSVLGLLVLLLSGAGHALGFISASATTQAFIPLFLLPLVTGAATHLLPLWLCGPLQKERELYLRTRLGRHAAVRSGLFLGGGLAVLGGQPWGIIIILPALLHFLFMVAVILCSRASTSPPASTNKVSS